MGRPTSTLFDVEIERWKADKAVQSCSYAARGLWFEMLLLMRQSERKGFLISETGSPISDAQLARLTSGDSEEVTPLLRELSDSNVFSRNSEGIIFNRGMVRDSREADWTHKQRSNRAAPLPCGTDDDVSADQQKVGHDVVNTQIVSTSKKQKDCSLEIELIFSYWQEVLNHAQSKLTNDRKGKIRARLSEGFTVEQLKLAVDGCKASSFHMGENDDAKIYDDIDLIFRNGSKVEKFISYLNNGGKARFTRKEYRTIDAVQEAKRAIRR